MCCVSQSLRDNCWKARDDSARLQKESEDKLEQFYRDIEVYTNEHLKPLCARACACVHACVTWESRGVLFVSNHGHLTGQSHQRKLMVK